MMHTSPSPVVHLELHTGNLARARAFSARVCGWRIEQIELEHDAYHPLDWGGRFVGGIVECGANGLSWLPHVEGAHIDEVTERARRFRAGVLLQPREGPAGWRSVVRRARGPTSGGRRSQSLKPNAQVIGVTKQSGRVANRRINDILVHRGRLQPDRVTRWDH